jgi:hypothetical protein
VGGSVGDDGIVAWWWRKERGVTRNGAENEKSLQAEACRKASTK